jgi:hypothetical protein
VRHADLALKYTQLAAAGGIKAAAAALAYAYATGQRVHVKCQVCGFEFLPPKTGSTFVA